ncbi:MAG: AraC family transcriptional regulator [Minicystis sp.]
MRPPVDTHATASTVCAAKILGHGVSRGLEPRALLAVAGLSAEQLADAAARVPVARVMALWEHVLRALDDASVPVRVAESTTVEDHGVMGLAILTSKSGEDAFARAVRYGRLFTEAGTWRTRADADEVVVSWISDLPPSLGARASAECAVGEFVHAVRLVSGRPFVPARVSFAHAAPRDTAAHARFFGGEVRFGAPFTGFRCAREALRFAAGAVNPAVGAFILDHAERMLARLSDEATLAQRVRAAVALELSAGAVSLPAVARRLGVGERTLRRHLEQEGRSFRALVDEVRRERARELVAERRLTLKEIAFLLGFSEPSAFSRAFKRWTGVAPRDAG